MSFFQAAEKQLYLPFYQADIRINCGF